MGEVSERERKIVVAVDEGEESLYALSWCLKNVIFENSKDTLILLYARPPRPIYTAMDGTDGEFQTLHPTEELPGYLFSADIMATLDRYSYDVAEAVVKVETRVESGDARDVICQMVEKLGADILVMGSHGYGPIKRAFIGSVSNHCAKSVKCPVLIVKKPKNSSHT
ncbi:universal stress protein A-like protein isoform X2 [Cucumis melo var. makuwa]|uniref:Universal stress protein A-like protein isoform X2 n=2 Tax=Cucumis melo var. makuwa TaxID=1194695 RepID=A0A5A7U3N2_CUCMM|nr:universal stress protein A-like protein isoform X2 [Cucumis melo var. makuwa]